MAECHPVGFQWVMEAKAHGRGADPRRPSLHPNERTGRRPRAACGPAPTSRSSVVSCTTCSRTRSTSATTSSPTPTGRRSSGKTSATPRTSTDCSPASIRSRARTTTRRGSTKAPRSAPRPVARDKQSPRQEDERSVSEAAGGESHGSGGASIGMGEPERDESMQHPRCVFQVLEAPLRPVHRGHGRGDLRRAASALRAGV